MKLETFNKSALIAAGKEVERLYLNYAPVNDYVRASYHANKELIDRAKNGRIEHSTEERMQLGIFRALDGESEFQDLLHAIALMDVFLEGWESEEKFNAHFNSTVP